jgi:hypothetical protein
MQLYIFLISGSIISPFSLSHTHSQPAECGKSKSDGAERKLCFIFFCPDQRGLGPRSTSCQIQNPEAAERKICARCFTTLGRAPINFYDVARAIPEPSWRQIIAMLTAHKLVGRSAQLISDIFSAVLLFTADVPETNFCALNLAAGC